MNLYATAPLGRVVRAHLVQPDAFARTIIKLVMVDFQVRERGVKGKLDVRGPRCKL